MRRRVLIENGPIGSTKTLSPMICNVNSCQWQWFASGGGPTSGDGPAGGDGEGGKSVNSPPAPPPSESEAENRTGVVIEDVDAEISPTSGGEGSGETEETGKAMPKDDGTGEAEAEAEEEEDDEEAMILQAKLARAAYKRQVSSLRRDFRSTSERRKARKAKQARVRKEQAKAKVRCCSFSCASPAYGAESGYGSVWRINSLSLGALGCVCVMPYHGSDSVFDLSLCSNKLLIYLLRDLIV